MSNCAVVNLMFDLDSPDGRTEFQKLVNHLNAGNAETPVAEEVAPDPGLAADPDPEPVKPARRARTKPPAEVETATPEAAAAVDAEDLSGPVPNGNGIDPVEELGFVQPSMSPAEAKDAALVLIREVYAAGKVAEVKNLQKTWGVAKFYDVPVERAHEFYRQVLTVAVDAGLRT